MNAPAPGVRAPLTTPRLDGGASLRPSPAAQRPIAEPNLGARPSAGGLRSFDGNSSRTLVGGASPGDASGPGDASRPGGRPPARSPDVRYGRPTVRHVTHVAWAPRGPPRYWSYRPYYTRWYVHPWYRYRYSTWAVVSFGFWTYPWYSWWVPPARVGWDWVPGYWAYGVWHPGHWVPLRSAPVGYVYVDGWWEGDVYVDGFYRVGDRDGWVWVQGAYAEDGAYVRGHWEPTQSAAPEGYTWEAGFWDGQDWIDGFWRPQFLDGYTWESAYYDEDGVYHAGYWMPLQESPGQVWVPGWFDGNEWVAGYWIAEEEYSEEAIESWEPPEGYDAGWEEEVDPRGQAPEAILRQKTEEQGQAPLAIPVEP